MDYIRDYTMYAAVFGWFSVCWFGWSQERPRDSWRKYIGIATLTDNNSFKTYLITVYIEFAAAGAGAYFFIRRKAKEYVAPWIAFVVGIHFIGLVRVFDDPSLYVLAVLLVAVSVIAVITAPKLKVASSAITGIGSGTVLFGFAVLGLVRYLAV
jgi:hypothetical protein